jgi:hypothetical protein
MLTISLVDVLQLIMHYYRVTYLISFDKYTVRFLPVLKFNVGLLPLRYRRPGAKF